MKTISLEALFVESTQRLIVKNKDRPDFHDWCLTTIVKPNMERINEMLGQENDPDYIAYAIEYLAQQQRG